MDEQDIWKNPQGRLAASLEDTWTPKPTIYYTGLNHTYPIGSQEELQHAARLLSRAHIPTLVKEHINEIAQHTGWSLPEEWKWRTLPPQYEEMLVPYPEQ